MSTENPLVASAPSPEEKMTGEVDTSAPFESVKEAASRFGGVGFWKPTSTNKQRSSHNVLENVGEGVETSKLEEEAAQLQRELMMKERETLDVLKELEKTKLIVEDLKFKVNSEESSDDYHTDNVGESVHPDMEVATPEENQPNVEPVEEGKEEMVQDRDQCPSSAPDFILKELKRAKLNLTKTTDDLVDIRATVALYKQKIEKERNSMDMTRQRLSSNVSKISSLEEELLQANQKLQVFGNADPAAIADELQRLSSETEQFKKMGEAARSEVSKALSEIEHTKTKLKTAEMRLIAARKMKDAARASEAVALAEIKWLSSTQNSSQENYEGVTLTLEEFTSLVAKAREAEETSKARITDAMFLVDEANDSKTKILKKIEEATLEVKTSKKALEDALDRVEAANSSKLIVEEALRKWRSERGQKKKRTSHDTPKFKNPGAHYCRRDLALLDVNGIDLAPTHDDLKPALTPTLSIGQILSRKLLLTEEYENGMQARKSTGKRKVSLGQMLGKTACQIQSDVKEGDKENNSQQLPAKRKHFGFAKISFLRTKHTKKKKKRNTISCSRSI